MFRTQGKLYFGFCCQICPFRRSHSIARARNLDAFHLFCSVRESSFMSHQTCKRQRPNFQNFGLYQSKTTAKMFIKDKKLTHNEGCSKIFRNTECLAEKQNRFCLKLHDRPLVFVFDLKNTPIQSIEIGQAGSRVLFGWGQFEGFEIYETDRFANRFAKR